MSPGPPTGYENGEASGTFCCGCGEHVPEEDLFWTETGQNVAEYNRGLQEGYLRKYGAPPPPEGVGQG